MHRPLIIAVSAAVAATTVTGAAGVALAVGLIAVPASASVTPGSAVTPVSAVTPASANPTPSVTGTCPCTGTAPGTGRGPAWAQPGGGGAGVGMGGSGMGGPGMGRGPRRGAGTGTTADMGRGAGMGAGMGHVGGSWTGDPLAGLTKGTLSADQEAKLAGMAEEEKLAHDVYVQLATTTRDLRFTRIAAAETRHLAEIRALLNRYGVGDPTAGKADGQFASAAVQQQYEDLVTRGRAALDAALAVGRDIENADIKDLAAAGSGVTAQDVSTVYARLANASRMHLRAFGG
jgi:hypothetical protein